MKKINTIIIASLVSIVSYAYTFTFEDSAVPIGVLISGGSVSLSTEHYKEGVQSLCWEAQGASTLTMSGFDAIAVSANNAMALQMYLPTITFDTLTIEFLQSNKVYRTATVLCNYKGWRELNRLYKEYASAQTFNLDQVRFSLTPASAGTRRIYFDAVDFNAATDANRVPGCMWVLDYSYLKTNTAPIKYFANQPDIKITTPTSQELVDLNTIRARVKPTLAYNAMQAIVARNWVNNNMTITRNADGSVCGTVIDNTSTGMKAAVLQPMLERLIYLAGAKVNGDSITGEVFDLYLDHLLDQGFADGANIVYVSSSYSDPRNIIGKLITILPACNDDQAQEVVKLGKWMCQYYTMYYPEGTWQTSIVSDILYLFLPYMKVLAAYHPHAAEAVRELKALGRYLNRNASYTECGNDMLKVDGTGFHHNTHYNNYMYAYQGLTDAIYDLRGTAFQLNENAYQRFGKAIISIYTMATPSVGDARHYPLTLCGRNPFNSGQNVFYNQTYWNKLIESGESYPNSQAYLQGAYNYFFQTNKYDVPEVSFEGFTAFNWSPIGVYRHNKWVATMHAPTTNMWGAEIYTGTNGGNRFGVYQAHGALEITYQGGTLAASGYPSNKTGGGWDWNVMPGTTTVHFTDWLEMTPNKNTTQRFDQYNATKDFSGAVGLGSYGVWGCDFEDYYMYGSTRCFPDAHLVFHKSAFVCDSIIVALGSGIDSYGDYSDDRITATNLTQIITGVNSKSTYVDGAAIASGTDTTLVPNTAHWLLNPLGTGYYIPSNNDALRIVFGAQTTPVLTGADVSNPKTTLNAIKAYINHGNQPENKSYEFVVMPGQTLSSMTQLATTFQDSMPYQVLRCDNHVHSIQYKNVTSFVFYDSIVNVNLGIVRSTSHQHLMIDSLDAQTGNHSIALCNPNIEPSAHHAGNKWTATPSHTKLLLNGYYTLLSEVEGVSVSNIGTHTTILEVDFNQGLPLYITLKDENFKPVTGIDIIEGGTVAQKFFRNNQLYILRNGVIYNILGNILCK